MHRHKKPTKCRTDIQFTSALLVFLAFAQRHINVLLLSCLPADLQLTRTESCMCLFVVHGLTRA